MSPKLYYGPRNFEREQRVDLSAASPLFLRTNAYQYWQFEIENKTDSKITWLVSRDSQSRIYKGVGSREIIFGFVFFPPIVMTPFFKLCFECRGVRYAVLGVYWDARDAFYYRLKDLEGLVREDAQFEVLRDDSSDYDRPTFLFVVSETELKAKLVGSDAAGTLLSLLCDGHVKRIPMAASEPHVVRCGEEEGIHYPEWLRVFKENFINFKKNLETVF